MQRFFIVFVFRPPWLSCITYSRGSLLKNNKKLCVSASLRLCVKNSASLRLCASALKERRLCVGLVTEGAVADGNPFVCTEFLWTDWAAGVQPVCADADNCAHAVVATP